MREYIIQSTENQTYLYRSFDMNAAAAELVRLQSAGTFCRAVAKTKGVRGNQLQGCGAEFTALVVEMRTTKAVPDSGESFEVGQRVNLIWRDGELITHAARPSEPIVFEITKIWNAPLAKGRALVHILPIGGDETAPMVFGGPFDAGDLRAIRA